MNVALYAMNSLLKLFPSVGSLDAEMRERIESLFEFYDPDAARGEPALSPR